MMKPSNYNFFYPYHSNENKYIAYNSFSNALALIDTNKYEEYTSFESDNHYALEDSLVQDLRKGSFVIDDDVDELALLRHRLFSSRYSTTGLGLTLAPTSDCNFRCVYCYEKGNMQNEVMTEETQQDILNFVQNHASYISDLHISWFGGEPLLALDIIENMTRQFLALAETHNFQYYAGIVTNGYLLTPENAKRLIDCKISSCQVTIDGEVETHNSRRPHVSGSGTYDTIMNNLQAVDDILPFISLRVNIDNDNKNAIDRVNDALKELELKNIKAYPAPIVDTNGCYSADSCLTSKEFYGFEYDFIKSSQDRNRMLEKYPALRGHSCTADAMNAYVINADGEMYKCWSDIGIAELSLGNIKRGVDNRMNEILYIKNDPTQDEKCSKCKFLPICLGGCPHDQRTGTADKCLYYSHLHKLYMSDIAQIMENRKIT